MKKLIAILLGFLAFGLVGYVGGQAQNQPLSDQTEAIRQLQQRVEQLERSQAMNSDCACIRVPEGSHEIEIGGVHFYLMPVTASPK